MHPALPTLEDRRLAWRRFCADAGAEFVPGTSWQPDRIQARRGYWILTLDTASSLSHGPVTRLRALFLNPDGPVLALSRRRRGLSFADLVGAPAVPTGHPNFDGRFALRAPEPRAAAGFLRDPGLQDLLIQSPVLCLEVREGDGRIPQFSGLLDELMLLAPGVLTDPGDLVPLFDLGCSLLERLSGPDEVARGIAILQVPPERIIGDGRLAWDGYTACDRAMQILAARRSREAVPLLLRLLRKRESVLRDQVIRTLGAIGDRAALPSLVPLLGRESPRSGAGGPVVEALGALGEGELAAAFAAALSGEEEALQVLRAKIRLGLASALVEALHAQDPPAAGHAAWVLGELGIREALPHIRRAQARLYWGDPALRRMLEATAALERKSSLPRPAAAPGPDTASLPYPAERAP